MAGNPGGGPLLLSQTWQSLCTPPSQFLASRAQPDFMFPASAHRQLQAEQIPDLNDIWPETRLSLTLQPGEVRSSAQTLVFLSPLRQCKFFWQEQDFCSPQLQCRRAGSWGKKEKLIFNGLLATSRGLREMKNASLGTGFGIVQINTLKLDVQECTTNMCDWHCVVLWLKASGGYQLILSDQGFPGLYPCTYNNWRWRSECSKWW